jgi:arylsulfatase A-like enzyme
MKVSLHEPPSVKTTFPPSVSPESFLKSSVFAGRNTMHENVILITVDCLRADHLGCMGYPKRTTPYLDALAAQGIVFTHAYSVGPVTPVSFLSLFTSTYPLMYEGYTTISDQRTTLAEVLTEHGYHTAAFHSNPYLSRYYRYERGFKTFHDSINFGTRKKSKTVALIRKWKSVFNALKRVHRTFKGKEQPHATADEINTKALSWIQSCTDKFFVWVHYMDVHAPYIPPEAYLVTPIKKREIDRLHETLFHTPHNLSEREVKTVVDLYDAEIRYVDHAIKRLLDCIGEERLRNTLVIITSDHGDEFGEHGEFLHGPKLYDELIHVPLIMWNPGLSQATITEVVSLLDISPTILDFLNIKPPDGFQGDSLFPVTDIKRSGVISEVSHKKGHKVEFDPEERQISYRTLRWKYIYRENGLCELYDLENDPSETTNVIDQEGEKADGLRSQIEQHIDMEDTTRVTAAHEQLKIRQEIEKLKLRGEI